MPLNIWEKGIPGYHFNNARAALSLSFRSCGQAAGWSCSLFTTTEWKWKCRSGIMKLLTRYSLFENHPALIYLFLWEGILEKCYGFKRLFKSHLIWRTCPMLSFRTRYSWLYSGWKWLKWIHTRFRPSPKNGHQHPLITRFHPTSSPHDLHSVE